MAVCSSLPLPTLNPLPKIKNSFSPQRNKKASVHFHVGWSSDGKCSGRSGILLKKLIASGSLAEIEPDLNEDPHDRWATNGIDPEDFIYGEYDGHHTYHEGEEKGTFWGAIAEDIAAVEPPSGFQGFISWLFLPAVGAAMYFNVPGEYLFIGAAVFATIFMVIELDKPAEPHNFEPQIYNMERGARDKLINDYNTMSIWEFNEKYNELWDFTVTHDEITKR